MKLKPVNQQVCVIVGASSGIGRVAAQRLASQGAQVVVAGRSLPELEALVSEILRQGGQAMAVVGEVSDFEQMKYVANRTVEKYGRIDTWVHSAAVMIYAAFEDIHPDEFKRLIDVNLMGQVYGAMAALPHLKREGRGALIMVSSVEGRQSMPLQSAYSASKWGVNGLAAALRMELEHEGLPISVSTIMPASINTPLYDRALSKLGVKPRPVPPVYEPELVAEAILYAAEHPVRDLIVGGAGKLLTLIQRISPRLGDALLKLIAFRLVRTREPKSSSAPNNLFLHIDGYDRVQGSFSREALPVSLYNWVQTRPAVRLGLIASVMAVAVILLIQTAHVRGWTGK